MAQDIEEIPDMPALLRLLTRYVKEHDPVGDPHYAAAAGLLSEAATEAQRHGQTLAHLVARAEHLLRATGSPAVTRHFDTQADWCEDILRRAGGPLRCKAIADQMYNEGYQHSVTVKNRDRQLRDSIWVAMSEDPRFVKAGRGLFDLAVRHEAG
jgi:hypothetical protein